MNGFHNTSNGGLIQGLSRVIAQVELPPGYYIIFAKVELSINRYNELPELSYQVQLELGDITDVTYGKLIKDDHYYNAENALISLNIAGEVKNTTHAKLVVSLGDSGSIWVISPRLSAIQVSELMISSGNLDIPDYVEFHDLLIAGMKTSNLTSFKSKKPVK